MAGWSFSERLIDKAITSRILVFLVCALLLALGGWASFSLQDAFVKSLVVDLQVTEVLFGRSLVIVLISLFVVKRSDYRAVARPRNALAIELMTAAAGVDQRAPLRPSVGVQAALAAIREKVAPMTEDRPLYRDIAAVAALMTSGAITRQVEAKVGALD